MGGFQQITISLGGTDYALQQQLPEWDAALGGRGYNRLAWPIGMAQYACGRFLVSQSTLDKISTDGNVGTSGTLSIGNYGATVSVQGLYLLAPTPLSISGLGQTQGTAGQEGFVRLYAAEVVDDRYYKRHRRASKSFNVLGPGGIGFDTTTLNSGTPYTYDQIITQLASDLSISITSTDGYEGTTYPVNVSCFGKSAAVWMDRMLAESGRVLVKSIGGTYKVEKIDKRTVFDVIYALQSKLENGCARYQTNTSPTAGLVKDATPLQVWQSNEVPTTLRVGFWQFIGSSGNVAGTAYQVTPSNNAATYSLSNQSGFIGRLYDTYPVYGNTSTPANSATLATRANDLAMAYYKRFLAGECDCVFIGIQSPTLGGSCQLIEFVCDGRTGFRTNIHADVNNPILGFPPSSGNETIAGADTFAVSSSWGGSTVQNQDRLLLGTIVSSSGTSPGPASGITYTVTLTGSLSATNITGISAATPFIDSGGVVTAAAPGTYCLIAVTGGTDSSGNLTSSNCQLLLVDNRITTTPCSGSGRAATVQAFDWVLTGLNQDAGVGDVLTGNGYALPSNDAQASDITFQGKWLVNEMDAAYALEFPGVLTDNAGGILVGSGATADDDSLSNRALTDVYGSPLIDSHGGLLYT